MSWEQLISIAQADRDERAAWVEVACPNDGEPYQTGPDGELFCPFDGYRPLTR